MVIIVNAYSIITITIIIINIIIIVALTLNYSIRSKLIKIITDLPKKFIRIIIITVVEKQLTYFKSSLKLTKTITIITIIWYF